MPGAPGMRSREQYLLALSCKLPQACCAKDRPAQAGFWQANTYPREGLQPELRAQANGRKAVETP